MKNENKRVEKVNTICKAIRGITAADFKYCQSVFEGQFNYTHPLKMKTAGDVNLKGFKNLLILGKLKELKEVIESKKKIKP